MDEYNFYSSQIKVSTHNFDVFNVILFFVSGKVNFGQLKKSLTVEKADYSRPMYDRDYDLNLEDRYQRLQINYNELDHVGNVYVPNRSKRDSIGSTM